MKPVNLKQRMREVKFTTEHTLSKEQLNKFTGYKCKALLYEILSDGTFINGCTRVRAPLMMNKDNMCVDVTCQRESCHADFMLDFYKQCQK
jgi:hypothetical protein